MSFPHCYVLVYDTVLYYGRLEVRVIQQGGVGQLLVVNDCAYRTRFTTQWALFMDPDEYLYATKPPHSVMEILDANEVRCK